MNALLDHFHETVNTPGDVEKLKRYILQLAMQGKLVEQDPNDEPASELLKRIEAEKKRLIKEKQIKKQNDFPTINEKEIPYNIPQSWKWVRVGEVTEIRRGASPRPIKNYITESDEGIPWIKIGDSVVGYKYITSTNEKVTLEGAKKSVYLRAGSLIMSNSMSFGKAYILGIDGCIHDGWLSFTIFNKLLFDELLLLFLNGSYEQFEAKAVGTGVRNLNINRVKGILIPIPPLKEQKRIVNKVEFLFKQLNKLSSEITKKQAISSRLNKSVFTKIQNHSNNNQLNDLRFAIENIEHLCNDKESIDQLRMTILSLAVQGKLLEQDVNHEPASKLIEKIKEEKEKLIAEKKIKKEKSLPLIAPDEIPYNIPKEWDWVRIGDLFYVGTGSTPSKSNRGYYDGGTVPWITSSATNNEYITNTDSFITELALNETSLRVYEPGTLVIALYGQGKTRGQVSELMIQAATNQACCCLVSVVEETVLKDYTKLFFKKVYNEIRMLAAGGAQPNLNVGKIKNTLIPIPPLSEMEKIVNKTNAILAIIEQLQEEIARKNRISEKLTNSVIS